MDTFTPKERAVNFSKLEKDRFQSLIEKYKDILFCKKTDNISNVRKNKTWAIIHAEFNAGGDLPRTLRQLKAKFDNMKRTARKDASHENINENENIIYTSSDSLSIKNAIDTNLPAPLLRTAISKPLRIHKRTHEIIKTYTNLKAEILTKTKAQEEHIYKLRIKHMEEKRIEEREIHDLQKKKLMLEISLLENKLNN